MKHIAQEYTCQSNGTIPPADIAADASIETTKDVLNNKPCSASDDSDAKPATSERQNQLDSATGDLPLDLETIAKQLNREVLDVLMLPVDQMIEPILKFVDSEHSSMLHAEKLHALSRMNRWATGRALIVAKKKLKHGKFGTWIKEHFSFSKSSAENYMKLARDYSTARSFLEEDTPLRELYADNDHPLDDGKADSRKPLPPSKTEAMLKILTSLQKCMRHVTESEEQLEDDQIGQLKLVIKELERYLKNITKNTKKS